MRRRLSVAAAVTVAAVGLSAAAVQAQQDGDGHPHVSVAADSDLQGGNPPTVRTSAEQVVVVPGTPPSSVGSAGGPGGGSGGGGGGGSAPSPASFEPAPAVVSALGGAPEPVTACFAEAFEVPGAVLVPFSCSPDDPPGPVGGGEPAVDPFVLALRALSQMTLPAPVPQISPSLEEGTYAQLATFFYLEEWGPLSNSAAAGSVTSTATATPVSHTWTINDTYAGGSESITCDGPGAPFDPSRPYEAQVPPECGWTPRHSSAGQTQRGGSRSEPCFPTTVTLSWDVTWTSNIAAGGDLGVATTTTEVCLVVAELQALVTAHGR